MKTLNTNDLHQVFGAGSINIENALTVAGFTLFGGYIISYIPYSEFFMSVTTSSAGTVVSAVNEPLLYGFIAAGALGGFAGSMIGIYLRDGSIE